VKRWLVVAACFACVYGCANTHHAPCELGSCPDGFACDPSLEGEVCVERCVVIDVMPFTSLCEDGAGCYWRPGGFRCAAGGTLGLDAVVDPFGDDTCAFGLVPQEDYTSDPLVARCVLGCSRDVPCPDGYLCSSTGCRPFCTATDACDVGDECVMLGGYPYCLNERRFDRTDCDGDGEVDCLPFLQCDSDGVGGCSHPPPEER
jgi:hypothetical protein